MNAKKNQNNRGVALVAVLAVLVVLTILASSLSVLVGMEQKSSVAQMESQRADILIESGIEHAKALIKVSQDMETKLGKANTDYLLYKFGPRFTRKSSNSDKSKEDNRKWQNVYDETGKLHGRYEIIVEDEAAKVNINTSALLGKSKGSGWRTSEVSLPYALGMPPKYARKILDYRYGPNKLPGMRGDDDKNNVFLMSDGIDNNANGLVDEPGEGIDDPQEYNSRFPLGDDRVFSTIADAAEPLFGGTDEILTKEQRRLYKVFPQRATLYSVDYPGSPTLPNDQPADVNAVTARQCRRRLIKANKLIPFEHNTKALDQLAANIVDYRDQNHVLSTLGGSVYGVEAVCFNELLANDGTEGRAIKNSEDYADSKRYPKGLDDSKFVFAESSIIDGVVDWQGNPAWDMENSANYYKKMNRKSNPSAWDVEITKIASGRATVKLLGPAKNKAGETLWSAKAIKKYESFREARDDIGKYSSEKVKGYDSLNWPKDFFKNGYIILAKTAADEVKADDVSNVKINNKIGKITASSTKGEVTFNIDSETYGKFKDLLDEDTVRCVIRTWDDQADSYVRGCMPSVNNGYIFQGLENNTYYLPVINNWPAADQPDKMPRMGFGPFGTLSGDNRKNLDHKWQYGGIGKDAKPERTSKSGRMQVFVRSGSDVEHSLTKAEFNNWELSCNNWTITFVRPEVIELININPNPISIRNWTLTFNSGSIANDIGIINSAIGYNLNGKTPDSNPVIDGNGYFYLVNSIPLFKNAFSGGTPSYSWGANASQENPVWEIPGDSWGIQYEIKNAAPGQRKELARIILKNEKWRPDQFKGEIFEATRWNGNGKICTATGSRYEILNNGSDWIEFDTGGTWGGDYYHFKPSGSIFKNPANRIMLLGLPAKGGVVSMTLKNEYNQIVSRTIDYGYLKSEPKLWYGRSTEKIDPTHYNWTVKQKPTISGKKSQAINRSMRGKIKNPAYVKNGPYTSAVELKNIRSAKDFVNLGSGGAGQAGRAVSALLGAFGSSSVRLEAADEKAERKGWKVAGGIVESSSGNSVNSSVGDWENGQWKNHTLRFMTGKLAGESFPIFDNSKRQLKLRSIDSSSRPKSVPGRKKLNPEKGDVFSIGPGYNSILCYTRKSSDPGEWLWKRRIPVKGEYDLYIFGLNDSINTTEFLEENHNSSLGVEVWNFEKNCFEKLGKKRNKYLKEDCFYAGKIKPANVSDDGDFKLRLVSHDVVEVGLKDAEKQGVKAQKRVQSGYAWFNYAVITPVPVVGRVNVNTASERLLRSLPGINKDLAKNIAFGINNSGKSVLKPYKMLGDVLKVKGMTMDIFERCANLFCLDTSSYTLNVNAQAIKDVNGDGKFDEKSGDKIEARKNFRCVMVINPENSGKEKLQIIERVSQNYIQ